MLSQQTTLHPDELTKEAKLFSKGLVGKKKKSVHSLASGEIFAAFSLDLALMITQLLPHQILVDYL